MKTVRKERDRRVWRAVVVCAACFGLAAPLAAQLNTADLLLDFDANVNRDLTTSNIWDSALNPGQNPWEFTIDTRVATGLEGLQTNAALGNLFGIGGRFDFPRTTAQVTSNRDRGWDGTYDSLGSTANATFEFWVRFDNTSANQILWESGGATDGSSFTISGGNLQWVVKDGGASDSLTSAIAADGLYHHVVGVYNRDDPNSAANPGAGDTMTLYVDGVQMGFADTETAMEDWSGSDPSSLGGNNSAVGADTGDLGGLDNYQNFDGRIAAFRFYTNAWNAGDVTNAITAVQAANVYFDNDGGADARWNLGDNWDTGLAPSVNQNVIINSGLTATISNGNLGAQTLYIGATNKPGTDAPLNPGVVDGAGTLNMSGGELDATQIIVGNGGNQGTVNFTDGTINVTYDGDADDTGKQALTLLHSGAGTNVFTMGTPGGGTSPVLVVGGTSSRRLEVGVNEGSTADSVAIFNVESGSLTVNANIVIGQSGINDNALAAFNIYGGDVYVRDQLNLNDGTVVLVQTNGTISMDDLQTMNTGGSASDNIRLLGGTFTIRDQMNDRAGNSDMTVDGGTLFFSAPTPTASLREVEDLTFNSGTIRFTIQDPATSPTALSILNTGTFTNSTGQIDLDIADRPGAAASTTTWTNGSALWTTFNVGEWDSGNPIQYITNGSIYTLIDGSAATVTNMESLTSAHPDFDLQFLSVTSTNDTVQIVATNNVATTPIKAVINAAGTVTRTQDLRIGEFVGADAADLDVGAGVLDLGGNNLQIGGNADLATVTLNGAIITNVANVNFGSGVGTEGGTLQLNGGTMTVAGNVAETDAASQSVAHLQIDGTVLTVGGNIAVQRFAIGQTAGNSGAYTITNGQSVSSSGTTSIGASGTGTLQIADGTLASNDGVIGEAAGGVGMVTMSSTAAVWTVNQDLSIANNGTGRLDLIEGTLNVGGASSGTRGTFVADGTSGAGTFNIGSPGGSTNILFQNQGGNFEIANAGVGVVNMYGGVMQQLDDNNIVVSQGTDANGTLNLYGGRINLLAVGGGSDVNFNNGIGVLNVTNGTLRARTFNLSNNSSGSTSIVNITGGDVFLTGNVDYRNNGTMDIVNLKGGLLELSGGEIRLSNSSALAGGTNQFNFTGGTLRNVGTFIGDLFQSSADAASVLDIGASPGTMQIQGDYSLISNGFTAALRLELFAMGTNAGTDFDFLTVVGAASLGGTVEILDQSAGAIDIGTPYTWNVIEAVNISTNSLFVDLPSGFFWQLDTSGANDIFQVFTIPEPSALILLGLGGLALGALRLASRRR